VAAVATSSQVRFKDSIVRVGVNYHFGSPAVSQYWPPCHCQQTARPRAGLFVVCRAWSTAWRCESSICQWPEAAVLCGATKPMQSDRKLNRA